jgi:hypothetical protein
VEEAAWNVTVVASNGPVVTSIQYSKTRTLLVRSTADAEKVMVSVWAVSSEKTLVVPVADPMDERLDPSVSVEKANTLTLPSARTEVKAACVVTVMDHVPAGMDAPTTPAVLHPNPLNEEVFGVPVEVEPDVNGLTMNVPVTAEPTEMVVVVSGVAPGETVVRCR